MAISPGSDIVLEVARAADPMAYRAAAARLQRQAAASASGAFAPMVDGAGTRHASAPRVPFDAARRMVGLENGRVLATPPADPYQQFEAFVLQTFVESMLPKGETALFGSGPGAGIWKSMLARSLGTELARLGGIGIAEMLAAADDRRADRDNGPGGARVGDRTMSARAAMQGTEAGV